MFKRCSIIVFILCIFATKNNVRAESEENLPRLELGLYGGAVTPTRPDDTLSSIGIAAGIAPMVRVSSPFAFGLLVEHYRLSWQAEGPPGFANPLSMFPDDNGSMSSTLIQAAARWYIMDTADLLPYLQLAAGLNLATQTPEHPDCNLEGLFAPQLAAGLDYRLIRSIRMGISLSAHPFAFGQGCNDIAYEGKPPGPPFPGVLISARLGLTTVWNIEK